MQRGAVVITKRRTGDGADVARAVRCAGGEPGADLDLLTDRFDELYARMQAPGVIEEEHRRAGSPEGWRLQPLDPQSRACAVAE
jgi:hypothetical protein